MQLLRQKLRERVRGRIGVAVRAVDVGFRGVEHTRQVEAERRWLHTHPTPCALCTCQKQREGKLGTRALRTSEPRDAAAAVAMPRWPAVVQLSTGSTRRRSVSTAEEPEAVRRRRGT
eukprot:273334-Pleurochrysis_carterae.AAC.1